MEKIWDYAFQHRMRAVASERPVLIAEASWSTAKERRGLMELMFEKFGVPAMFPAKNAMLSAFSAGRATALVRSVFCLYVFVVRRGRVGAKAIDDHGVSLVWVSRWREFCCLCLCRGEGRRRHW